MRSLVPIRTVRGAAGPDAGCHEDHRIRRGPEETHALFPQNDTTDQKTYDLSTTQRLAQFDEPMKKGTGLAVFHYTTHVVNETAQKVFSLPG
jgi:hypothetical protein